MVFGGVVSEISVTRSQVDKKFLLGNVIFGPVEVHIHSFYSFDFNCFIGKINCGGVISLYRSWWL